MQYRAIYIYSTLNATSVELLQVPPSRMLWYIQYLSVSDHRIIVLKSSNPEDNQCFYYILICYG